MKKIFLILVLSFLSFNTCHADHKARQELRHQYEQRCQGPSDICKHVHVLRKFAMECSSVAEIGLRGMNSTWGILQGLSENSSNVRTYLGIDLEHPEAQNFNPAKSAAEKNGITFTFLQANDMDIDLEPVDMLFIDSLHIYCHLSYELEKFSSKVRKYIAMHDTGDPWGEIDDFQQYHGDRSEYPAWIDKEKRGLWLAVVDFLQRHPEWKLEEQYKDQHGFTVLKRVM